MAASSKASLLGGTLWSGFATAVNRVLPALLIIVLAGLLEPWELGAVSFVLSSYTVLSIVADWGIAYAFQKLIPENPSRASSVLWTALVLRASISVTLGTICMLLDAYLGVFRGYGPYVFVLLVSSALGSGMYVLNAQFRFRAISLLSILQAGSWFVFAVIMILLGLKIQAPIYGLALAYVIVGVVFFAMVPDLLSPFKIDRGIAFGLIRFGGWATLASGLSAFTGQAALILLPYLLDENETGIFRVALTLSMVPMLLGSAIALPLLPLARRSLLDSPEETARIVRVLIRYLLMIGLFVVGAGVVLAKPLIDTLVKSAYAGATEPFRVLLVANLLGMLFTVLSTFPFMGDGLRELAAISLQMAIAVLVGNLVLIPLWGNDGSALALLLANAVGLALIARWFRRRLPFQPEWRRYLIYGLATVEAMAAVVPLLLLVPNPAMVLGLGIILATIVYVMALLIHKGVSVDEIRTLIRLGIGSVFTQVKTKTISSADIPY